MQLVAGKKILKTFNCRYAKFTKDSGNICVYSLDYFRGCKNRNIIDRYKDRLLLLCIRLKRIKNGGKHKFNRGRNY